MKKYFIAALIGGMFLQGAIAQVSVVTPVGNVSITADMQAALEAPAQPQQSNNQFSLMGLSSGVTIGETVDAAQGGAPGALIGEEASFKQDGATVKIEYSLFYPADIVVSLSTDGGQTFGEPLRAVSGDVGTDVPAGKNTIVWNAREEIESLQSEQVAFRVAVNGAETFTVNGVSFTMLFVPGGEFTMGATDGQLDKPVGLEGMKEKKKQKYLENLEQRNQGFVNLALPHNVILSDYYIGSTEVTQGLWEAVMGTGIDHQKSLAIAAAPNENAAATINNMRYDFIGKGDNYPMYYITYDECLTFIQKLNELTGRTFRLPTEAEWEYAARGGQKSHDYKYSGSDLIEEVSSWENEEASKKMFTKLKPSVVGQYKPNELGIFDMTGNVSEWCQDIYVLYSYNTETQTHNPTGPESGDYRAIRGIGKVAIFGQVSGANARRQGSIPNSRGYNLGFRLVLVK